MVDEQINVEPPIIIKKQDKPTILYNGIDFEDNSVIDQPSPSCVFILIEQPDHVEVMHFIVESYRKHSDAPGKWMVDWRREPTEEEINYEITRTGGELVPWHIITQEEYWGGDRDFRNAWSSTKGHLDVDMEKAREIHMANIRFTRDKKLTALDGEWMKYVGQKDDDHLALVEAQKQILRDIPATVDLEAATNLSELKAIWPTELD